MTTGRSQPDDQPEDETRAVPETRPFTAWPAGASPEATTPPSYAAGTGAGADREAATTPAEPGHARVEAPPTIPSERLMSGDAPPDEINGIHGPPQPGQILFGRYRAEKLLGEGGMGSVWLVTHLELDTLRALKLIVSGIAFDPGAQARFKREARVMARLSHPNAVVVHDASITSDAAFIEMEYIRGVSLNRRLKPGSPMPLDWTARILEQLCDVLEEAHRQKIVHRDLKPANLMLLDGRPVGREALKVLDFGIAKILESETAAGDLHTNTGNFLGSAPYSSPEQANGTAVDARSDIYSVGIILYELLTSQRPFSGPITRIIYDHLYTPPPPFSTRGAAVNVPEAVEQVVLRCLAKSPADRPQSARELWEEFRRALPETLLGSPPSSAFELPRTELEPPGPSPALPGTEAFSSAHPQAEPRTEPAFPGFEPPPASGPAAPQAQKTVGLSGYAPPRQAPSAPPLGPTDWDRPAVAPPKPGAAPTRGGRRLLLGLAGTGVVLVVAALAALALTRNARPGPAPPPKLPAGYDAADAADLVAGAPRVLVRTRDKARFLRMPAGTFTLGNDFDRTARNEDEDQPAHPVTLSGFYIQETEVTNAEMEAYFRANRVDVADRPARWREACERIDKNGHDPALYPAVGIPYDLAARYARWVGGALPTEAQWEYAARSLGKPNPFVWGAAPLPDPKYANVESAGLLPGSIPTSEVGKYPKDRTEQGVLDLMGNVREWCRDFWSPYTGSTSAEPVRDPSGPANGSAGHVIRGGSWAFWKDLTRTTRPRRPEPTDLTAEDLNEDGSALDLGFRVVLEWPR